MYVTSMLNTLCTLFFFNGLNSPLRLRGTNGDGFLRDETGSSPIRRKGRRDGLRRGVLQQYPFKSASVSDRLKGYERNWCWTREPAGRTQTEFEQLKVLTEQVRLDDSKLDSWRWSLATDGIFSVKVMSQKIDGLFLQCSGNVHETLMNKLIPKKVEIFFWRAQKKRLLARIELDKRGIDLDTVRCPNCDDGLESVDHALLSCKQVREIWKNVFKWWNLGSFNVVSLDDIFKLSDSGSNSSFGKSIWQATRWICTYLIWKNRNNLVFRNKKWNVPMFLNEIQLKSFEWLSLRSRKSNLDWHVWLSNPSFYLTLT
ncbi:uncharacterized protein [Rutidosis leptorrhynchoides]|uniref:uncharacterized protein n=1 Tax=Rutidosis leptorrhynchoides TaxID=125765 RepID=UPI003A99EFEE